MENTDKLINSLWAKKEERNARYLWLPLTVHLEDTMNVSRWLFANWLSESQRELCSQGLRGSGNRENVTTDLACDLAAFLGGIHDIGKATPAFQTKKGFNNSQALDDELICKLEMAGFSGISNIDQKRAVFSPHALAGEVILKKFGVKDDIGSIVGGHHGKPIDSLLKLYDQGAYYAKNYFQSDDPISPIYGKWYSAQKNIFEWALSENGFSCAEGLPEISEPAQVIYEGLLIMADWIASNTEYFPLIDMNKDAPEDPGSRCQLGIARWSKGSTLRINSYQKKQELFNDRFKCKAKRFSPNAFQNAVYDTTESIKKPGIMILEAPMGLGKTEAALAAAEVLMARTGSSGLFFGLPTQATSNSMFSRVESWLEKLAEYHDASQSLRLSHGKAAMNDDMNRLRNSASQINTDGSNDENVFVNEWFSGRKKAMLDDFVVGTVDGFLLSALKQKHLALRHLGFSKKVVIIDEVHAYDAYMQQYLERAISWMGAYGTPVILVSATLPPEKRKSLVKAYLGGMEVKNCDICFPDDLASTENYPIITYTEGKEVRVRSDIPKTKSRKIRLETTDENNLIGTISDLLKNGGVLGIVVNTVKRAQELGRICKAEFGDDTVEILHSSFIAADRVKKETDLVNMIGKDGARPEKKIVIGTQVIEQSLDIDFDVMITDLCPIDLLLQRAGRLHRHDIDRPVGLEEPVLYVMGTNKRFKFDCGSEMVYGKYLLIRTQYYLRDIIRIPADIPVLIQKVYGKENLKLDSELSDVYEVAKDKQKSTLEKKRNKAQAFRLDRPKRDKNLIGWLKDADDAKTEEIAAAQVRDVHETIEVIAVKKAGTGYGTFKDDIDVSGRISDPYVAKTLAKQTIRIPDHIIRKSGIPDTIKTLEEYNWRELREWQDQPWLTGELGIIFDENGMFELNGKFLKYDNEYGLREVKEDGKI